MEAESRRIVWVDLEALADHEEPASDRAGTLLDRRLTT